MLHLHLALAVGFVQTAAVVPPPLNVVLIVSDDQGLADFSRAGHPALETPHLDRLAAASPRVERFYVSPVCSPTRASLMTGRWNYRTGVVDTWIGRSQMHPSEVTLAEVLRDAGYATGIFGKLHLGDCYPLRPIDQGFERSLVHRGGGLAQPSEPPANARRYTDPILFRDGVETNTQGYCTDVYFDAALGFIDASVAVERPFFAYVATNTPHDPYHDVPAELYAKYTAPGKAEALARASRNTDREARICAMIENIDANVGRLLARLDERGLAERTLIVFLNDNGPVPGRLTGGLRGAKSDVHEGGIRAPLFMCCPSLLDPATQVAARAAHVDLFPTILELAHVAFPTDLRLDGLSLAPLLLGAADSDAPPFATRNLFLQSHRGNVPTREHHFAVIGPRYKLVRASGFGRHAAPEGHPFALYDLLADPGETRDLAADEPERVAVLRRAYNAWFDDVMATRPPGPPRIVVGEPAELRTVLTAQDRWCAAGEGWNNDGGWRLATRAPREVEVALQFTADVTLARARLSVLRNDAPASEGDVRERALSVTGARVALGALALPGGEFELRVELFDAEGAPVSAHHVELTTR